MDVLSARRGTAPPVDDDGIIRCDAICAGTIHSNPYSVVIDIYSSPSDMALGLLALGLGGYTRVAMVKAPELMVRFSFVNKKREMKRK